MDKEQAKNFINDQLEYYLEGKGIDPSKNFNCLNPLHDDGNYRMAVDRSMGQPYHTKCKGCNAFYNTLDLIEIDYKLTDPEDIFNKACEVFNIAPDENGQTHVHHGLNPFGHVFKQSSWTSRLGSKTTPPEKSSHLEVPKTVDHKPKSAMDEYLTKTQEQIHQTTYFQNLGLSSGIIERFKLGYDPDFMTKEGAEYVSWQAVIIPTGDYSYTALNTDLSAEIHNRIRRKGPSTIFNQMALQNDKPVFIVEEEIGALILLEIGAQAIAIGGTGNIYLLSEALKNNYPAEGFVICLGDNNDGNQFTSELRSLLSKTDIPFLETNLYGDYKDFCEALNMARDEFLQTVQAIQDAIDKRFHEKQHAEREAYLITNSAHHLQSFLELKDNINTSYLPTGFQMLDVLLDGGLYEGLYILAGMASSGKTAWALQLADQIAQAGTDVLIFSLETARTELIARSISRLTYLNNSDKNLAISTRGITTIQKYSQYSKAQLNSIKTSMEAYGKFADKIYITEGMDHTGVADITDILTRHIGITGNKPVIIIDNLKALASSDDGNDHPILNKTVPELKRISRDYRTPLLVISTINPCNNNVSMNLESFKGTTILDSSDVLLGLQLKGAGSTEFDLNKALIQNPRELELKVLKNRNGASGGLTYHKYCPMFNSFIEG